MKVTGIIAEYDPFHNGHEYHIKAAMEKSSADFIIVLMSGEFTQRGMPAAFDKTVRAAAAIENGADIVFELPYIYACNSSHEFAYGAVKILNGLGCVTDTAFGAEEDDISILSTAAKALCEDGNKPLQEKIRANLSAGISYGNAVTTAFSELMDAEYANVLKEPNNLLAIEYLKQIITSGSNIKPHTIKRLHSAHNSSISDMNAVPEDKAGTSKNSVTLPTGSAETPYSCDGHFLSGSAIRQLILENNGDTSVVKPFVPAAAFKHLARTINLPNYEKNLFKLVRYKILTTNSNDLSRIYSMSEGIENRIISAAHSSESWRDLLEEIKTKRFTLARIRRLLMHILMNHSKLEHGIAANSCYARLLGFSDHGADLLKELRKTSEIPIISNLYNMNKLNDEIQQSLAIDSRAVDIFNMINEISITEHSDKKNVPFHIR